VHSRAGVIASLPPNRNRLASNSIPAMGGTAAASMNFEILVALQPPASASCRPFVRATRPGRRNIGSFHGMASRESAAVDHALRLARVGTRMSTSYRAQVENGAVLILKVFDRNLQIVETIIPTFACVGARVHQCHCAARRFHAADFRDFVHRPNFSPRFRAASSMRPRVSGRVVFNQGSRTIRLESLSPD